MKKLTQVKLINWHYFVDVTININGAALITGDNGAGKSTILDAIQFVLTAGKTKFNSAAHDMTKRNLLGYVRCKTGYDSDVYERKGDITCHIALEFYDESKKRYFLVGTVIDSSSDLSSPKVIFYRVENQKIIDEIFLNENIPYNISEFKSRIKGFEMRVFPTQYAAQADFRNRFGSLNERFFQLVSKSLAFKPIHNIKDFVYSYVLDEKEVNIEYLKENVRTYKEFETILMDIKNRVDKLDVIQKQYDEIMRIQENIKMHEYIIIRSGKEIEQKNLDQKNNEKGNYLRLENNFKEQELQLSDEINHLDKLISDIRTSMLNNETYQIINNLENEIKGLENDYFKLDNKNQGFDRFLREELNKAKKIYQQEIAVDGLEQFVEKSKKIEDEVGANEFANAALVLQDSYSLKYQELITKKANLNFKVDEIQKHLETLEKDIKILESKKLVYDDNIIRLKKIISEEIQRQTGKEHEPKILCELIEIQDSLWKDAIEGYLNTQRFDLIVDPDYFDISLKIYDDYKARYRIHSVGLVNTQKVQEVDECALDSLANVITSKNHYAKCYVNQLLGRLVRCEHLEDLKKYKRAITPTCMVYQNNTARQINPAVYNKPYIGAEAYKAQLLIKMEEKQGYTIEANKLKNEVSILEQNIKLLSKSKLEHLSEICNIKVLVRKKQKQISIKKEQLKRIDKSTILQMELELTNCIELQKGRKTEKDQIHKDILRVEHELRIIDQDIQTIIGKFNEFENSLKTFEEKNLGILAKANDKYVEELKNKNLETVHSNFKRSRSGFDTQLSNWNIELVKSKTEYNNNFHFGAATGLDGMDDFQREYKNLKESKIIEFEEKISLARKKAEEQFQEHFLAKLQENIFSAQHEFKKLNNALKGIKFGEDEYEFKCIPSNEYYQFYQMIMDESNLESKTLFSGVFQQKHRQAMDELFERITIDDEQSQKALEKFTDYRTFLDYDIKIFHENGTTSSFSKVCREKSGGETQTPYYVAIAASFLQVYSGTSYGDSIGLMLFDEAFDKMDESRIESMMTFLKKLNLQVILAAPPQKVESISPYVGTTLIVSREDKFSWVEALYIDEKL